MKDSKSNGRGGVDRRTFLKGALAAGAVATAASVAGCGTQKSSSGSLASSGYESAGDWLGSAPSVGRIAQTLSSDILVVGGGNAGIQAALAAAESGASVNVIEAAGEDDRRVRGVSVGCVNPTFLANRGAGPFDAEEICNQLCLRAGPGVNHEIIRKYVANSGETLDHMLALVSWPNKRIRTASLADPSISPLDESQFFMQTAGDGSTTASHGGYRSWASSVFFAGPMQHDTVSDLSALSRLDEIQQFSLLKSKELGAHWYYGQSLVKLQQDSSGAVTGAVAKTSDGSYVAYNAKFGVILCTGDYGADKDMVWGLNTQAAEQAARAGASAADIANDAARTGMGIKAACWAGATVQAGPRGSLNLGGGGGGPWGLAPFLWVDSDGKRFMNEAATPLALEGTLTQAAGTVATICDAGWADTCKAALLDAGMPLLGRAAYLDELVSDMGSIRTGSADGGQCRSCASVLRERTTVYAAATLDELCGLLGYRDEKRKNLLDTIARYNVLCDKGTDTDFGKDAALMKPVSTAPFFGTITENKRYATVGLVTLAGLSCDGDLRVLNKKGEVIKGLYAAGNCLGGRFGVSYAAPFPGLSVGMAITYGRLAGRLATGQTVS